MFRCEKCSIVTPPRQPINYIVTEKRNRSYEYKIKKGKKRGQPATSHGWEIIQEIKVCPACYRLATGEKPRVVESVKKSEFKSKPKLRTENRRRKEWKNPNQKKSKQEKQEIKEPRKPIVEIINPLTIVKE